MAPVQVIANAMRMSVPHLKTLSLGMMFVGILLWGTTLQAAVPVTWKASGFSIDATNMTLRSVLDEFGRVYGVRVELSANGAQIMRSRLKADTGNDFLDRLGQLGNFRWFVYGETLYVVPAGDNISLRIDVGEDAVQDSKAALVGLGLFDDRFGWGELPDTGTVIVSGPRAYVNLARDILLPNDLKEKAESKAKRIMMFRLKYASATDRVINSRGRPETIPGVKTMLTSLLFGPTSAPGKLADSPSKFDMNSRKPSRTGKVEAGGSRELTKSGSPSSFVPLFSPPNANASGGSMGAIARQSESSSSSVGAAASGSAGSAASEGNVGSAGDVSDSSKDKSDEKPRIEANPSLNAIMIYDSGNKRAMYAALIAELDVQPQQVEIEALIIDIDRSKIAEMGIEWGVTAGSTSGVVNSTASDSLGAALPVSAATLLISNAARFYARLKALESKGDAHILATPTVLTLDNVAAVLDLSQTAYVSLVGERVADLADITAGTMLRVIPRIIHDGGDTRVHLEVDIEDGSLNNPSTNSASTNVNVTRSTISTQAIIDLQQTLMIGGYHAESLNVNRQKVPLLGDLPYVGGLFRSESKTNSTKERLFLITPRLAGNSIAKAPTNSKAGNRARAALEKRDQDEARLREMELAVQQQQMELMQQQMLQLQQQQQQLQQPQQPALQPVQQPAQRSPETPAPSKFSTSLAMADTGTRTPAALTTSATTMAVPTPSTSSYSLAAPVAVAASDTSATRVAPAPAAVTLPSRAAAQAPLTQPVRSTAAMTSTPAVAPAAATPVSRQLASSVMPVASMVPVAAAASGSNAGNVSSLPERYVAPVAPVTAAPAREPASVTMAATPAAVSAASAATSTTAAAAPVASLAAVPLARPSASMTLGGSSAPAAAMYPAAGTSTETRRTGTRCARPKLALKLGSLDLALNP